MTWFIKCINHSATFLLGGVFFTLWGSKLLVLNEYSVDIPFEDEWDADGLMLFKPWTEGTLDISDLFATHGGEHFIVLTRIWDLGWFLLNGQWSPQLVMAANAVVHTIMAVLFYRFMSKNLSATGHIIFLIIACILISMPYSPASILVAFQSQFYFLLLFSILSIWLILNHDPPSAGWWVGMVCIGCACLSITAGLLVMPAIVVVPLLEFLRENRLRRSRIVTICVMTTLFLIGFIFRPVNEELSNLTAISPGAFLLSFSLALSWPFATLPWISLLFYSPFLIMNVLFIHQKIREEPIVRLLLGVGWLIVIVAAAAAYTRGGEGSLPAIRYLDIFLLGILINFGCFLHIPALYREPNTNRTSRSSKHKERQKKQRSDRSVKTPVQLRLVIVAIAWVGFLGSGLYRQGSLVFSTMLPARLSQQTQATDHIKNFLATDDVVYLQNKGFRGISYSGNFEHFVSILSDPTIRSILPSPISPETRPVGWLTQLTRFAMRQSIVITAFGILMMGYGCKLLIGKRKGER